MKIIHLIVLLLFTLGLPQGHALAAPFSTLSDYTYNANDVFCDGAVDDTALIQRALDHYETWKGHTLRFPRNKTCRATGLKLTRKGSLMAHEIIIEGNGSTIKALDGAIWKRTRCKSTSGYIRSIQSENEANFNCDFPYFPVAEWSWGDQVLSIDQADNLEMRHLTLDGNRDNRPLYDHFGQMHLDLSSVPGAQTLKISDSSALLFEDVRLLNAVVDGVYIFANQASTDEYGNIMYKQTPKDIDFKGLVARNSARANVVLINCHHCTFDGGEVSGAHGLPPEDGFDLEPNYGQYDGAGRELKGGVSIEPPIKDVVIKNMLIKNNRGHCINLNPTGGSTNTRIIGNTIENCALGNSGVPYGVAINVGHSNTLIKKNTFQNFKFTSGTKIRSLIDFSSENANKGSVIKNTFRDIDVPEYTSLVYFHASNGRDHELKRNKMDDVVVYRTNNSLSPLYWCRDYYADPYSSVTLNHNSKPPRTEDLCL